MARLASILKNENRKKLSIKQFEMRTKLNNIIKSESSSDELKLESSIKLQKLNRNGSKTRVRSRCSLTGRPRAVFKKFGLCRIKFREMALRGMIPGVTKASW